MLLSTIAPAQTIDEAFVRLYSFDFSGAHRILDRLEAPEANAPMSHAARASVFLFEEMDRLGILASEFFLDDGEKISGKKLKPSPDLRERLQASVEQARTLAAARTEANPSDAEAWFTLSLASGIDATYVAFVENRRLRGLPLARQSHLSALRVIEADPNFNDAYLVTGLNEYIFGSLPFFIRWAGRFDQVRGDKRLGIERMKRAAGDGRYLTALAKILLATVYIREKQHLEAQKITLQLVEEYPENPSYPAELEKLRKKTGVTVGAR
jgi:hypothetical protein